MKPHSPILLLAAALVLAGLDPRPAAAQTTTCTPGGTPIQNGTFAFGSDQVTFGGDGVGCMFTASDSIDLDDGWVYVVPTNSGNTEFRVGGTTGTVKVTTTYTTAASCSDPEQCTAQTWTGPDSVTLEDASTSGTFLVVYEDNSDAVAVALLSGSMIGTPLQPGCQTQYTASNNTTTAFDPTVLAILSSLGVSNTALSCLPCPESISSGSNIFSCVAGGYNAVFAPSTSATVDTTNGNVSIALLNSGAVYLGYGGIAPANTATVSTNYTGTFNDTTYTFSTYTQTSASFAVQSFDTDSVAVIVVDGTVQVPLTPGTATSPTYGSLGENYQMMYWNAGPNGYGQYTLPPGSAFTAASNQLLCQLFVLPGNAAPCST